MNNDEISFYKNTLTEKENHRVSNPSSNPHSLTQTPKRYKNKDSTIPKNMPTQSLQHLKSKKTSPFRTPSRRIVKQGQPIRIYPSDTEPLSSSRKTPKRISFSKTSTISKSTTEKLMMMRHGNSSPSLEQGTSPSTEHDDHSAPSLIQLSSYNPPEKSDKQKNSRQHSSPNLIQRQHIFYDKTKHSSPTLLQFVPEEKVETSPSFTINKIEANLPKLAKQNSQNILNLLNSPSNSPKHRRGVMTPVKTISTPVRYINSISPFKVKQSIPNQTFLQTEQTYNQNPVVIPQLLALQRSREVSRSQGSIQAAIIASSQPTMRTAPFFERMQQIDDTKTLDIKDILHQGAKNLVDISEIVVSINHSLDPGNFGPGCREKNISLENFNRRILNVNAQYKRQFMLLVEDLEQELRRGSKTGRTDVSLIQDIIDRVRLRHLTHDELIGNLKEIGISCDPYLSGKMERILEETLVVQNKRNLNVLGPDMTMKEARRAPATGIPDVQVSPIQAMKLSQGVFFSPPKEERISFRASPKKPFILPKQKISHHKPTHSRISKSQEIQLSRVKPQPLISPRSTVKKKTKIQFSKSRAQYKAPRVFKKPEMVQIINTMPKRSKTHVHYFTTKEKIASQALASLASTVYPTVVNFNNLPPTSKFFERYKTKSLETEDTTKNKISLNPEGTRLYSTSPTGTLFYNCGDGKISQTLPSNSNRKCVTIKSLKNGMVVLQEANSNNLLLCKTSGLGGFTIVKKLEGMYEAGKVIEDFHNYRHSHDDHFFLWRSGQDNISIVDLENFEVNEVLKRFWIFNKLSSMPFAACSDRHAERILATSQSGLDNFVVHYYENSKNGSENFSKSLEEVIPNLAKLTCLDVSKDASCVFLAGTTIRSGNLGGKAVVLLCEFNKYLKEIDLCFLDNLTYGTPRRLKRIKGTDIVIVACDKHFAVLEFCQGKLIQIGSLENIHDNEICDFELRDQYLYSTAFNEPLLKLTTLNLEPESTVYHVSQNPTMSHLSVQSAQTHPHGYPLPNENTDSKISNFLRKKISAPGLSGLEKVTASVDGRFLYAGGNGLHRFVLIGGRYEADFIQRTGKLTKFFGFKATNSLNLVYQEATTNNLVILDGENFTEEDYIKGAQKCAFEARYLRNPHFSGEDNTVLWFCGTSTLAVMNFDNLEPFYIENAVPFINKKSIGMITQAVSRNGGELIFIVYLLNNIFYVTVNNIGEKTMDLPVSKFLNNFSKIYSLELSAQKDVIFCGGTTARDRNRKMYGTLAAVSFDEEPVLLANRTFSEMSVSKCSSIKILDQTGYLLVGCYRHLLVVEYLGHGFAVRNFVRDLHSYAINDICVSGNYVFTVCKEDEYINQIKID